MSLHRDVLAEAISRACPGTALVTAAREAEDILDELHRMGWHLSDVADRVEQARARRTDPDTSRTAAESVDDLNARQSAVLFAYFERGPRLTDFELEEMYPALTERLGPGLYPPQTNQSLRSRRAELVRGGLIRATDERRPTETGHLATVWEAVG